MMCLNFLGDVLMMNDEYVEYCRENCNRKVTVEDIIHDVEFGCNFCDVPYIYLERLI